MTMFLELSFLSRAGFGLWTLLLCLGGIVSVVLSLVVRRYRNGLMSLPLLAMSYLMWQVTACFLYLSEQELTSALCIRLGRLPYMAWILILLLLTVGTAALLHSNERYARAFITPLTIEHCADKLSCGICYWQDNGHVVFSNDCMNTLSTQLTGMPLMNGKRLRDAVTGTIMPVGDRVWQFAFRDVGRLHELIASDVSELYAESETLRQDNVRLAKMNEELRVYGLKIDETVRRQEMLQAKVNIHHEMNRLMLSTIAADLENDRELSRIFSLWESNALLLCMESSEDQSSDAEELERLALALGVRLLWEQKATEALTPKQRELFFFAAREAITNSVKHAGAKAMEISLSETPAGISCTFQNDGSLPTGEIRFTGGLAHLELLASQQKAFVSVEATDFFRLCLKFSH